MYVLWVLLATLSTGKAFSYEIQTHRRISEEAFLASLLNKGYLKQELSTPRTSRFLGRNANEWLQEGSEREDDVLSGERAVRSIRSRARFPAATTARHPMRRTTENGLYVA